MPGKSLLQFVEPEFRDEVIFKIGEVFTHGSQDVYEVRGLAGNGMIGWYRSNIGPIFDQTGKVESAIIITRDITDQKLEEYRKEVLYSITSKANENISSKEFFRYVKSQIQLLMGVDEFYISKLDEDKQTLKFLFYEGDQWREEDLQQRADGNGLSEYVSNQQECVALTGGQIHDFIKAHGLRSYGRIGNAWIGIPLHVDGVGFGVVALQSFDPEVTYTMGDLRFLEFVTQQVGRFIERKKAEEQRAVTDRAFSSASEGIVIIDPNQHDSPIVFVNDAFSMITGYSTEEVLGLNTRMLYGPETNPDTIAELREAIRLRVPFEGEILNYKKDGTHFWNEVSISPVIDRNGELRNYIGILRDITDKKVAEDTLKAYNNRLESKNTELEQFAYIASHDLQEPLVTISSLVEFLELRYNSELDNDGQKALSYLSESTERMRTLIQGLLAYSRIGSNTQVEKVDCNKTVSSVLADLGKIIDDRKALIEFENLPTLYGHDVPLKQLFQNLISNGIKFCTDDTAPHIRISAELKDKYWIFVVEDNGIGIDPEYHDHVFKIFQRLHNRTRFDGTGIGLAHCRKIVELHDGKIWIESEPGAGSKFCFTIHSKLTPT